MIENILSVLNTGNYYGVSERVDIAKGKYQIPTTWKDTWKYIKRTIWQKRK
jgi:hypothetical protein